MPLVFADPWLSVFHGDALAELRGLPDASADCVVTSPPYWQQRSYLPDDSPDKALELGQEPVFEDWVRTLVEISLELRRVLVPKGSLWLNVGDRYCAHGGQYAFGDRGGSDDFQRRVPKWRMGLTGYPPEVRRKSLVLAPYRLAIAMQEAGWIVRDRIVWWKPNGLPESVGDRLSLRDEVLFRFTTDPMAHFDLDAIREPYSPAAIKRSQSHRAATFAGKKAKAPGQPGRTARKPWTGLEADEHRRQFLHEGGIRADGKNPGNVWRIATSSRPGNRFDHFAMFPPELIRKPILATCPRGGGRPGSVRGDRDDRRGRQRPDAPGDPHRARCRVRRLHRGPLSTPSDHRGSGMKSRSLTKDPPRVGDPVILRHWSAPAAGLRCVITSLGGSPRHQVYLRAEAERSERTIRLADMYWDPISAAWRAAA